MSFLKDCVKTFTTCVIAGSGQMIGMTVGAIVTRSAGKMLVNVIDEIKKTQNELGENTPYRRTVCVVKDKKN